MIKNIIALMLFSLFAHSMQNLTPTFSLKAKGDVQDIVYHNGLLYAGNSNGSVEIFDLSTQEMIKRIEIPTIIDFMGDEMPSKIYSIDVIDNRLLIVSQGMKGYRNLWIYENDALIKAIDIEQKYFIRQAAFVNKHHILFALLSNQIGLYNLQTKKLEYMFQVSPSSFSHFKLSEDKQHFVTTDESGVVRSYESLNGKFIQKIGAKNLDRVYQLDYKNGVVLTAGQDRKAVIYSNSYTASLDFDFLLYSCALSDDASLGAVSYNEKNEVLVFDVQSRKYLYNLMGQKATLTQILFISNQEVFASSDSEIINYWKF
jgi:WD40 repeat protein